MTVNEARKAFEEAGLPVRVAARQACRLVKIHPGAQPRMLEVVIERWKQENAPDSV